MVQVPAVVLHDEHGDVHWLLLAAGLQTSQGLVGLATPGP
jgi:hypothetical protein